MSNVIQNSIDLLVEQGWIKKTYYQTSQGFCMLGALAAAHIDHCVFENEEDVDIFFSDLIFYDQELKSILEILSGVIADQYGYVIPPDSINTDAHRNLIADFNDSDSTQWDDILVVMQKAALVLDEHI